VDVVILAAGAGRRFGGAKQFVSVAPDGATLLEVTLRDARRAGCTHAVIVTAPSSEAEVRALFETRPMSGLDITIVLQRSDDLPAPSPTRCDRPWGTAHAVWTTRHAVTGPFLLFNADDHYGPNAPAKLAAALDSDGDGPRFAMLGYPLGSTLSAEGTVSRAICETDDASRLTALHEYPAIDGDGRVASGRDTGRLLPLDAPVSMNAWGFTDEIFPLLESHLLHFLATADLATDECYLPAAIDAAVRAGTVSVQVLTPLDQWCGMTWPEDRRHVEFQLEIAAAIRRAAADFGLDIADTNEVPFGGGLIHATWRLDAAEGPHLLQRLNDFVFTNPAAVADNAAAAASRVDAALHRLGDDDPRHRLVFRTTPRGRPWTRTEDGAVWRAAALIPHARAADPTRTAEIRAASRLLGRFPGLVADGADFEPPEILPGFHDTPARLAAFEARVDGNVLNRLSGSLTETSRLLDLAPLATRLRNADLPVRLVHNDAKLDNVLVDETTGEALCVVDLDTVMQGLAAHDFGDLVRSTITGYPEDEPDLSLVTVQTTRFRSLAEGYLEGAADWIEDAERAHLVDGVIVITYEQALRFLADHVAGDIYYSVDDPEHNLRRARAQLRLLEALLADETALRRIIDDV